MALTVLIRQKRLRRARIDRTGSPMLNWCAPVDGETLSTNLMTSDWNVALDDDDFDGGLMSSRGKYTLDVVDMASGTATSNSSVIETDKKTSIAVETPVLA